LGCKGPGKGSAKQSGANPAILGSPKYFCEAETGFWVVKAPERDQRSKAFRLESLYNSFHDNVFYYIFYTKEKSIIKVARINTLFEFL
jgi:hypothetical protein